jgi:hypothetical protein
MVGGPEILALLWKQLRSSKLENVLRLRSGAVPFDTSLSGKQPTVTDDTAPVGRSLGLTDLGEGRLQGREFRGERNCAQSQFCPVRPCRAKHMKKKRSIMHLSLHLSCRYQVHFCMHALSALHEILVLSVGTVILRKQSTSHLYAWRAREIMP